MKVLKAITSFYLRLRVKDAHKLGSINAAGKVVWQAMGEVIHISDYLERKAAQRDPSEVAKRLADIALEMLLLQSEKNRLEKVLDERQTVLYNRHNN